MEQSKIPGQPDGNMKLSITLVNSGISNKRGKDVLLNEQY